jgi:ABC-type antimicrobial peptide transport system permease subunit
MKKLLGILIAIIIVIVIFTLLGNGLGFGFGKGKGDGSGEGTRDNNTSTVSDATEDNETKPTTEDVDKAATIAVTVFENDYIYQNKKTSLNDFIKELKVIDYAFVVEVTDDNASLKAYNNLIEDLEEESIEYTEK